jgi:hypothetical protein
MLIIIILIILIIITWNNIHMGKLLVIKLVR